MFEASGGHWPRCGFVGVQRFYLGRWLEGFADVLLTFGWVYSFATGKEAAGLAICPLQRFGFNTRR